MFRILSRYIAGQYIKTLLLVILLFNGIILLFDLIEQSRVFSGHGLAFTNILKLSIFRMFYLMQKTNAYAVLLAGIITYSTMMRHSELIVMRASGISNMMFLMPAIVASFLFGFLMTTIINPMSSIMITEYEKIEAIYKKGSVSALALSKNGLWLKDKADISYEDNDRIIHALRVSQSDQSLHDVTVYILDENQAFKKRYDMVNIALVDNAWAAQNVTEYDSMNNIFKQETLILPTHIKFSQIEESMLMPETISFWRLPSFITIAESSGFAATKHKIYFYKLLIQPLYFASMAILGIAFALSMPRSGKNIIYIALGLSLGFVLNFFEYLVLALGTTHKIPVLLAAFSPTMMSLMIGTYMQLHHKD